MGSVATRRTPRATTAAESNAPGRERLVGSASLFAIILWSFSLLKMAGFFRHIPQAYRSYVIAAFCLKSTGSQRGPRLHRLPVISNVHTYLVQGLPSAILTPCSGIPLVLKHVP